MERISLDQKVALCQSYGSIQTLPLKDAKEFYIGIGLDEDIPMLIEKYEGGKYLCGFTALPGNDDIETVYQITTFGNFVRNLVYPSIVDAVKTLRK